jgi:hypothetical protein
MAVVDNNIVTRGLSGSLGDQLIFRKGRGGQTIVAAKPAANGDHEFNPAQLAHHEAFRNAIAYARDARDEEVYITRAQGTTMTAFNAAVADWFKQPKVLEIDPSGWTGETGQIIRVKAQDDTFVASVRLVISDEDGNVLEQGDAQKAEGLWWEYTATTQIPAGANPGVIATVQDLPGNTDQMTWQNN